MYLTDFLNDKYYMKEKKLKHNFVIVIIIIGWTEQSILKGRCQLWQHLLPFSEHLQTKLF